MSDHISFEVHGKASPSGSKKAFVHNRTGKVIVMDTAKNKDIWQNMVSLMARKAVSEQSWPKQSQAVSLSVVFRFRRPKSHFRSGKNFNVMKATSPLYHTQKPDLTKLVRCLEDALTGVVWNDDCQVIETKACKEWGDEDIALVKVKTE